MLGPHLLTDVGISRADRGKKRLQSKVKQGALAVPFNVIFYVFLFLFSKNKCVSYYFFGQKNVFLI